MTEFRNLLLAWLTAAWPMLIAYQRRFVENNRKDDGTWASEFGTKAFQLYEWTYLHSVVAQSDVVRDRLVGELRTALGASGATDHVRSVGQLYLDAAYAAISNNHLLRPDPLPFFEQHYPAIEAFLTAPAIPYHAISPLHNVRIGRTFKLDDANRLERMPQDSRSDPRWREMSWDDRWELPAQFEHRFSLPLLKPGQDMSVQPIIDDCREAVQHALITVALLQRSTATAGPIVIETCGFVPTGRSSLTMYGDAPRTDLPKTFVSNEHDELLMKLWTEVHDKRGERARLAGGHLAAAGLARDPQAELMEVTTALEAALGGEAEHELRYRMALLAARLSAVEVGKSQRKIHDTLLSAFQLRRTALRGRGVRENRTIIDVLQLVEEVARVLTQLRVTAPGTFQSDVTGLFLTNPPIAAAD